MLFSGKENVFMCLVALQKNFRKIFSGVWLCSWKYHRKHIFYLLLTFSHIFSVAKRIYNPISQLINTETKLNQKKFIKSGQIHQNPTISQLRFEVEVKRRSRRALGSPTKSNGEVGSGLQSGLWVRSFSRFASKVERQSGLWVAIWALGLILLWVRRRSRTAKWALGCDLGSGFELSLGSPTKLNGEVGSGLRTGL